MMNLYFYLVSFFSISYLMLPFNLFIVLQFLHFFFSFFYVLSQDFIKCIRKAFVCIYINMYNTATFRKIMNFCLTKKYHDILIPLF